MPTERILLKKIKCEHIKRELTTSEHIARTVSEAKTEVSVSSPPSSSGAAEVERDEKALRDRAVKALSISFLFGVSSLCAPLQLEPELITSVIYKGDVARAAAAIAAVSGLSGALEFVLNPTLGRLSDRLARTLLSLASPTLISIAQYSHMYRRLLLELS